MGADLATERSSDDGQRMPAAYRRWVTSPDRIVVPQRTRVRTALGAVVVLVLVGVAVAVGAGALGSSGVTRTIAAEPSETGSPADIDPAGVIYVHLLGAVERPGLFELHDGDRAIDAVAAAGGFTATADQSGLNLARVLSDGEQIIVPEIGVVPPVAVGGPPTIAGKVNLNSADEADLDTLPGVGPATAKSIIAWRDENGRFTSVEDLMSVGGIGDKTFAALKDLVTV